MNVSYKKLWKMLIDRDLKKKDLEEMAGVSHYTMNKLTHGDNAVSYTHLDVYKRQLRELHQQSR